ncbi:hypothetical protein EC988_002491 [Linderina pennispora]|nr:hypothetical protein EC988_002491 [Linderina pennispora]
MFNFSGLLDGSVFLRRREIERRQQVEFEAREADRKHREKARERKLKAMPRDSQLPPRFRRNTINIPVIVRTSSSDSSASEEPCSPTTIRWAD